MSCLKDELKEAINNLLSCDLITKEEYNTLNYRIEKGEFYNWKK